LLLGRRAVGGGYVRALRVRGYYSRANERDGAGTADRRPRVRRPGRAVAGWSVAGVRLDPRCRLDRHLYPGLEVAEDSKPHARAGRRFSTQLVTGRADDCVLLRSWNHVRHVEGTLGTRPRDERVRDGRQ